jgi:PAS domain S-box-containing protein
MASGPAAGAPPQIFRLAVRRAWLAVIVVLVAVIVLEALLTWQASTAISQLRQREFEVLRSSRILEGSLPSVLNSGYGYWLTQDPRFLDDLAADRAQVQAAFAQLRGAVLSDDGAALIAPIGQRLDLVLVGVDRRIELARISRPDEARRELAAARGEQKELFALIDALVMTEERTFTKQLAELQRQRLLALAAAAVLLAALGALTFWLLRQSQRRLATAHRDLEQTRAQLYETERQARERATSILESIGDAFFALDRDWRFAYVNRAAERMLWLERDDLLGKEIWAAYPRLAGGAFESELRTGAQERARRQFETFFEPLGMWWEVSVFPAPDGLSVYLHDITARKQGEAEMARLLEQMRVAEARYRGLFEGIDDAIIVADSDGRFIDANPAATVLSGYNREELLAMSVGDLGANGIAENRARFEDLERLGRLRAEIELRRKDGSIVPTESWQSAVSLPTSVVYVAVWRDISERRALELMQREFLAMVTHELKTPLTTIGAYAQFMRRRGAYNETAAETIVAQSRRLDRLIEDLLDVSRLDAGRTELRREPIDLGVVVRAAAEQARVLSPAHQIEVNAPAEATIGWFDRDRLMQILQNLLSNAIKYSPEGSRVRVTLENAGDWARLTVEDRGVGIPPEVMSRLFNRFFRAPAAQASRVQGLGLGLYITKGLVEAHGGQITVESTEGVGSSFTVTLPFLPPPRR